MAFTELPVSGFKGFFFDPPSRNISPEVWTVLLNCRIENGSIVPAEPYNQVLDTPTDNPYMLFEHIENGGAQSWIYPTASAIYSSDGTSSTDVTRTVGGAYATDDLIGWDGGVINQMPCLTNGVDTLQIKEVGDTDFKNDPNYPATYRAHLVRGYKNRIVTMKLTIGGNDAFSTLLISDIADPGFAPASWDAADPTTQANEIDLTETPGEIRDGLALGDSFYVYKSDSVWRITYVGGAFVDSIERVPGAPGALSKNCVQEFDGNHFVVGVGDVYINNGTSTQSIISEKNRSVLYGQIDPLYTHRVFTIKDESKSLIYICFPQEGSNGACTGAIIWNWKTGDFGHTELPSIRSAALGTVVVGSTVTFDGAGWGDGLFDDDVGEFNEGAFDPSRNDIVLVSYENTAFYQLGYGEGFLGLDADWVAQKFDITTVGDQTSQYLARVIPLIEGEGTLQLRVGTRDRLAANLSWSPVKNFTVGGNTYKIDLRNTGRYISLWFSGSILNDTKFYGYVLEGLPAGTR